MLGCWRVIPTFAATREYRSGFCCRAEDQQIQIQTQSQTQSNGLKTKKKVLVVGSGWAGLGAAHHLCKQGFDVSVLEGGYDFGLNRLVCSPDDYGIRGFWYPFRNIFDLVDELGIKPFTNWTRSAQYSGEGLEVEFPIFQDLPQWPTPFGTLFYTEFIRLSLVDRLTSLPLMAAVVDFDNTDTSWRKYDTITARELFRQFGCSERLYQDVFNPLLQVGLFAPAEQCSAAATLGMLYYFILAHQKDFDLVWCRGTVGEKIFGPWMDSMRNLGCKFLEGRKVTDFFFNMETGCISEVILKADAVILAVGISTLQEIIQNSAALCTRDEFLKVLNLASIDLLTVKLQLDSKVNIPKASNACSGFDDSNGWTFFDLNAIYDEHKDDPVTVVQADLFHATELLPLKDEDVVAKAISYLSKCIKDFENVTVIDKEIGRFPKSLTHFFPGSHKYMMRGSTSFPNLFMAGDWIITRHGSWSQEKSFVTGLEAANCWDRGSRPRPYRNHAKQKYTPTHKETQYFTWFGLNAYVHGRVAGFHYTNLEITERLQLRRSSHSPHSHTLPSPSLTPRETGLSASHLNTSLVCLALGSHSHLSLLPSSQFIDSWRKKRGDSSGLVAWWVLPLPLMLPTTPLSKVSAPLSLALTKG